MAVTAPSPVSLHQKDGGTLYLQAMQRFTFVDHPDFKGERKVSTQEYAYTLSPHDDLRVGLFCWEWNPNSEVWPDPHAHVLRGDPEARGLGKLHLPTGRVALEDVLKFCIVHQGVETIGNHDDAMAGLEDSLRRFRGFATW
jgi:hypothetical protein